jgi:phosphoribosylanthranilate isomerase
MTLHVKICGLTYVDDALLAAEAEADLLGFILYPKSPRYVRPERVQDIVARLSSLTRRPLLVGVFVDEPVDDVRRVLDECGLDLAQLHGSEPPAEVALLTPRAYKTIRPQSRGEAEAAVAAYAGSMAEAGFMPSPPGTPEFLIDAYHPWRLGGTGRMADWHAARVIARRHRILLAGGLTPDNVAQAIAEVQPWGVDVSSGVEVAPGRKDPARLRAFVAAARQAAESGGADEIRAG